MNNWTWFSTMLLIHLWGQFTLEEKLKFVTGFAVDGSEDFMVNLINTIMEETSGQIHKTA